MYHVERGKIGDRLLSQETIETVEDTRNIMAGSLWDLMFSWFEG